MQEDPTHALSQALRLDDAMPVDEKSLHVRYVRALALLCECAAYVDEPHYIAQIEQMLRDAASRYPLDWRETNGRYELAPRETNRL